MAPEDPNASAKFDVFSGTPLRQQLGFTARSCIIDNNTSSPLYVDAAGRYVPANSGAAFAFPAVRHAVILWQAPPGKSLPTAIVTEAAQITFYAAAIAPGIGTAIPTPLTRWDINSAPAAGSTASASQAAMPGVTHVADLAVFSLVQNGAVSGVFGVVIRDGATGVGTIIFKALVGVSGTAGDHQAIVVGPGLNIRGTAGNAMTIEFQSGAANVFEAVSLGGFDQ